MKLPNVDKLQIVFYPDPILKRVCAPVEAFGSDLSALAEQMLRLMREVQGVGLAAPQVAVPIRLFVCNLTGDPHDDLVCVNPRLVELTDADEKEEGCLSIPSVSVTMRRARRVVMEALSLHGEPFRRTGEDLVARAWQHEVDHLDGRLITDHMSPTDEITNRRTIKQLEADYTGSRRV